MTKKTILYKLTVILALISAYLILVSGINVNNFPILVVSFVFGVISTLYIVYDTFKKKQETI